MKSFENLLKCFEFNKYNIDIYILLLINIRRFIMFNTKFKKNDIIPSRYCLQTNQ